MGTYVLTERAIRDASRIRARRAPFPTSYPFSPLAVLFLLFGKFISARWRRSDLGRRVGPCEVDPSFASSSAADKLIFWGRNLPHGFVRFILDRAVC